MGKAFIPNQYIVPLQRSAVRGSAPKPQIPWNTHPFGAPTWWRVVTPQVMVRSSVKCLYACRLPVMHIAYMRLDVDKTVMDALVRFKKETEDNGKLRLEIQSRRRHCRLCYIVMVSRSCYDRLNIFSGWLSLWSTICAAVCQPSRRPTMRYCIWVRGECSMQPPLLALREPARCTSIYTSLCFLGGRWTSTPTFPSESTGPLATNGTASDRTSSNCMTNRVLKANVLETALYGRVNLPHGLPTLHRMVRALP